MKKFKKILALVLAFTMIMGLAMTASAKTIVSTNQDASVMTMSSTNGTVSYNATTVQGDGSAENPTVTRYSYYIMLPKGGSLSNVNVTVQLGGNYKTLKADNEPLTTNGSYSGTMDFTTGTKTFVASGSGVVDRTFQVTAGVEGSDLKTVYVRVDVRNAVDWLTKNPTDDNFQKVTKQVNAIKNAVPESYKIGEDGIMTAFVPVNLKAGSTAMDALKTACETLKLSTKGSSTYVSGIGANNTYLSEFSTTNMSGWMYLDKTSPSDTFTAANYGAASYNLVGGEYFAWIFVNGWDSTQLDYLNQ